MKKLQILLPLAAVLLSLTGCKKDNEKSGPSGETVTLSATLGGGEKTEIYEGTKMKWSEGDEVNINGTDYTAEFPLDGDTYTQASFVGVERAKDGKYYAYYPASLYQGGKCVLPSTQTYHPENGNKLSDISPMYAVTETTELRFHNICALVKLQVKGEGTVNKIVVSSTTTPLCGEFEVRPGENGKYYAEIIDSHSADNKVLTLECSSAVTLKKDEATTFYIALPQGELQNLIFQVGAWGTTPITTAKLTAGKLYTKELSEIKANVINGKFSVAADKQVYFSQGNLQCVRNGSTWDNKCTWRFAENQWDYVATLGNVSTDYADKAVIDQFGWGTSGYDQTSGDATYVHYQPWSTDNTATDHDNNKYGYGPAYNASPNFLTGKSDWGYNAISNGDNRENAGWRTLTKDEWSYLLNTLGSSGRMDANRFAKAKVNGVRGLLIFPDGYTLPGDYTADGGTGMAKVNNTGAPWPTADIPTEKWTLMESSGAVLLPAAGYRHGTSVGNVGFLGYYWSSTPNGASNAFFLDFHGGNVSPASGNVRYDGRAVRLVLPVEN